MSSADTSQEKSKERAIALAKIVMEWNADCDRGVRGDKRAEARVDAALSELLRLDPRLSAALFCAQCDENGDDDPEEYPMPERVRSLLGV
jgi:hypothetical protein